MKLPGSDHQVTPTDLFDASGTLGSSSPVMVLPRASSRSILIIQNLGTATLYVDFGYARAGAVTTQAAANHYGVASVAVANVGQGYSIPPKVYFHGGGNARPPLGNTTYLGVPLPDEITSGHPAQAHCVMSGSAPNQTVSSIVIDDPGNDYISAPLCLLINDPNDPNGCVAASTSGSAIALGVNSAPLAFNASFCPTTPVVLVGTSGTAYVVKYAP